MDPKNAIEIRNIVKTFKIEVEDPEKKGGILNRNPTKTIENKVLDGITLDIRKGDVLGVLGRNGSGKSTFLSMIARIMEPDSGTIECSGKVASILELGMGFHQDMSGRENIYLKGELYGFSRKEMESKIDRIIEYSGISKYIDNPVRTYSSGMSGRLAFSIMMNVESDIMLVDEILSIGDISFMTKAREHFKKLAKSGKTIIIVSHSINDIENTCNKAIWIENGKIVKNGPSKEVCSDYLNKIYESPEIILDFAKEGLPDSQYKLALMYRDGSPFGKNKELSREWMEKAAEQGHTRAQIEYADILAQEGKMDCAIELYQLAANKGDEQAKQRVASIEINDNFKNNLKAILNKIGTDGGPVDKYRCGECLSKLASNNEEMKESFKWFLESADNGYPNAIHQVAIMCANGSGTPKNITNMETYLLKASEIGYIPSIIFLADAYMQGRMLSKNEKKAFELYLKGAQLGNEKCMYQVAIMYKNGIGTNKNQTESEKWFKEFYFAPLAKYCTWVSEWSLNNWPCNESFLNECNNIASKKGVINSIWNTICKSAIRNNGREYEIAINQLKSFANSGNVDAMRRLGNIYYCGIGTSKNYIESLNWYKLASKYQDAWSINRLGEMYRDGKGLCCNLDKAVELFKQSMHMGNIYAMHNLIDLYASGTINNEEVLKHTIEIMKRHAMNGNSDAAKRLGNYYSNGFGVKRDYDEALKWYNYASKSGDTWSLSRIYDIKHNHID